jgi:hypothetical protein
MDVSCLWDVPYSDGHGTAMLIVLLAKADDKPHSSSPIGGIDKSGVWLGGEIRLQQTLGGSQRYLLTCARPHRPANHALAVASASTAIDRLNDNV